MPLPLQNYGQVAPQSVRIIVEILKNQEAEAFCQKYYMCRKQLKCSEFGSLRQR